MTGAEAKLENMSSEAPVPLAGTSKAFDVYATRKTIGLSGIGLAQIQNNIISIRAMFQFLEHDIGASKKAGAYSVIVLAFLSAALCMALAILLWIVGRTKLHKDPQEKIAWAVKLNKAKMWISAIIGVINTAIFFVQLGFFNIDQSNLLRASIFSNVTEPSLLNDHHGKK